MSEVLDPPAVVNVYDSPVFSLREVRDLSQHLAGRVKTIIDAAIADPRQNKALKDLVRVDGALRSGERLG